MYKEKVDDEREIDLLELIKALWHKAVLIVVISVIFAAAAYVGTKLLVKPTYQSTFTAYVNNKTENTTTLNSSDISASQSLTNTYAEIIKSYTVLDAAIQQTGLDLKEEELAQDVTVDIASNTQIITVSVVMESAKDAYAIANAIKDYLPSYGAEIIEGSSLKIIDVPIFARDPYGPNCLKSAILGFILGFVLTCVVIVIQFLMDTVIKSESALENAFGIAVIGIIPNLKEAEKVGSKYGYGYGKHR